MGATELMSMPMGYAKNTIKDSGDMATLHIAHCIHQNGGVQSVLWMDAMTKLGMVACAIGT